MNSLYLGRTIHHHASSVPELMDNQFVVSYRFGTDETC